MGMSSPAVLQNTVLFYLGLHFVLRGEQEQHDLQVEQLERVPVVCILRKSIINTPSKIIIIIPSSKYFYMRPLAKIPADDGKAWYTQQRLGVNKLKNMQVPKCTTLTLYACHGNDQNVQSGSA